jgi:asparagine synthase (glutamine-hydrolysing)
MSMAVSLEARVPLLDHKLLEFAARVPSSLKMRNGTTKYLLRQALNRYVPAPIVNGPKHGFTMPIGDWLRGPLKDLGSDLILGPQLHERGLFRRATLTKLWNEHQEGRRNHQHRLWTLLMLELWFRQFCDKTRRVAAA